MFGFRSEWFKPAYELGQESQTRAKQLRNFEIRGSAASISNLYTNLDVAVCRFRVQRFRDLWNEVY